MNKFLSGLISLAIFCFLMLLGEFILFGGVGKNAYFWMGGYFYLAFRYGWEDPIFKNNGL